MSRPSRIHPNSARQVASHIIEKVWQDPSDAYEQVQPGVFTGPDSALVVLGAAAVSEAGETALRLTGGLWELAALVPSHGPIRVYGPRHLYAPDEWADIVSRCVGATRDYACVFTTFEVAPVTTEQQRADVAAASLIVGSDLGAQTTEPSPELLGHLLDQLDRAVEEAA